MESFVEIEENHLVGNGRDKQLAALGRELTTLPKLIVVGGHW